MRTPYTKCALAHPEWQHLAKPLDTPPKAHAQPLHQCWQPQHTGGEQLCMMLEQGSQELQSTAMCWRER